MILLRNIILLCITAAGLGGCGDDPPALSTIEMTIGNRIFQLEIAANDANRQKGLMDRDSMPMSRGMIFVFADEAPRAFWMKNTRIALDILYLNRQGEVVDIKSMQPLDLRSIASAKPAKFAIELNYGAAQNSGVKLGDRLSIPPAAAEPAN